MSQTLKLDQFQMLFYCKYCLERIRSPVILPCGVTICKNHSQDLIRTTCTFCSQVHELPTNGFTANEILQQMLAIELNKLTLSPKFNRCKTSISQLQENAQKIYLIQKDPDNYIHDYFEELKRQTDLRRENLKSQVDTWSNDIIMEITRAQTECKNMAFQTAEISKQVDDLRSDLNSLINRFDSFEFSDEKHDAVLIDAIALKPIIDSTLENYKNMLVGNKDYSIKFEDINLSDMFGSFKISNVFMDSFRDSKILDKNQATILVNLCEFAVDQKWKLAYRATENGFDSKSFHSKASGVKHTLTIVRTPNGNIFGGFTDQMWGPEPLGYAKDENAFLFSLVNKDKIPIKLKCFDTKNAIYRRFDFLVEFGNDLVIASNSNEEYGSISHLNERYCHSDLSKKPESSYLAGSEEFLTSDIELYYKVN